jgi:hypothetical protein
MQIWSVIVGIWMPLTKAPLTNIRLKLIPPYHIDQVHLAHDLLPMGIILTAGAFQSPDKSPLL